MVVNGIVFSLQLIYLANQFTNTHPASPPQSQRVTTLGSECFCNDYVIEL